MLRPNSGALFQNLVSESQNGSNIAGNWGCHQVGWLRDSGWMTRKVLGKLSSWRIVNQVNQDMQAGSQISTHGKARKTANLGSFAKRNLEFLNQVPSTGNLEFFVCARNKHPQTPFASERREVVYIC